MPVKIKPTKEVVDLEGLYRKVTGEEDEGERSMELIRWYDGEKIRTTVEVWMVTGTRMVVCGTG